MNDAAVEITVRGLRKQFGELEVLKGVDLDVRSHEVVSLIGPSGSGKSTLLRCLNLLEMPDAGIIRWRDEEVPYRQMEASELTRHRTRMGMVFQHFHLFPNRTALENVIEGLVWVLGEPEASARDRGRELLDRVGLADKAKEWPARLSGGQKQRVAIARALAMNPEVLLLDEVTSALDVEMIAGINDLLEELAAGGMTMVAVTHDLGFARRVASRICFLDGGVMVESGIPDQVLDHPETDRLQEFLSAVSRAR